MHWTSKVIAILVVTNAGWMAFDGARAMVKGDYVTPKSGAHAGQLGPWSQVVKSVGIEPRSTLMKSIFVVYGLATLMILAAFLLKISWAWSALLAVAVLGIWYLPFGTLLCIAVIILLQFSPLKSDS